MTIRKKIIGQLIHLLQSEDDGDIVAATKELKCTLASVGVDAHQFAGAVRSLRFLGSAPATREAITCTDMDGLFRPCGCGGDQFKVETGSGSARRATRLQCLRQAREMAEPSGLEGESS